MKSLTSRLSSHNATHTPQDVIKQSIEEVCAPKFNIIRNRRNSKSHRQTLRKGEDILAKLEKLNELRKKELEAKREAMPVKPAPIVPVVKPKP